MAFDIFVVVVGITEWDAFVELCNDDEDEEKCAWFEFCDWDNDGDCDERSPCVEFCGPWIETLGDGDCGERGSCFEICNIGDNWLGDVGMFSLLPSVVCIFWMNFQ